MASPGPRWELVQERLSALASDFGRYVDAYDEQPAFTPQQLRLHRQTIALGQQANGVGEAIDSDDFCNSLRATLQAWGLGFGDPDWRPSASSTRPSGWRGTRSRRSTASCSITRCCWLGWESA